MPITISDAYERSSVDISKSSVIANIVTLCPRLQKSNDVAGGEGRWLEPSALVSGVIALNPVFRFTRFIDNGSSMEGNYHYPPWQASRRAMYSYDGITWKYFDKTVVRADLGYVEFSNNSPFLEDTIYVSRSRQMSVHRIGIWLASINHPAFGPSPAATTYTPTSAVNDYLGQEYIANEFKAQINELGKFIPPTPFYAAQINDLSLMPSNGVKRLAILVSGVHAGEDTANFVLKETIDYLLGSSSTAQALRREFRILVYPMINAPGRAGGGWRGSFTLGESGQDDANRHFHESGTTLEIVDLPKLAMLVDRNRLIPAWMIDYHGAGDQQFGLTVDTRIPESGPFHTAVVNASGLNIDMNANAHDGQVSNYFRMIGCPLSITSEVGDVYPLTDAGIKSYAIGMMQGIASMKVQGVPAPTPAPAPVPAPTPPPQPVPVYSPLVMTDTGVGRTRAVKYTGTDVDNLTAMTIMSYIKPTGRSNDSPFSYIMSKRAVNGEPNRFYIDDNGGQPRVVFGLLSASNPYAPNATTAPNTTKYNIWQHVDVKCDNTGISIYINGIKVNTTFVAGIGSIIKDTGSPMVLLNREDLLRSFTGEPGYINVWNRALSDAEMATVRAGGKVTDGLIIDHQFTAAPVPSPAPTPAPAPSPTPSIINLSGNLSITINSDGTYTLSGSGRAV
jgi:hypothetical protein